MSKAAVPKMEFELCAVDDVKAPETERENKLSVRWMQSRAKWRILFRLLLTAFAFFPHICCGLLFGCGGPAFLDLIQLTKSNVEEGSIFFTSQYLGMLVVGTVAGPLYDRFNIEPLLFTAICLTSGLNIAIPYCNSSMWVMAVVNGLKGGTMAIVFTGAGLIIVRVWSKKESGSMMQALHFAYSIGGVVAPFIVRPFLAPRYQKIFNDTTLNYTGALSANVSYNTTEMEYFGETHVDKAFLIIGLITLSSAIPFVVLLVKGFHITSRISDPDGIQPDDDKSEDRDEHQLSVPVRVVFIIFIVLYYIMIVGAETLFQNYTMTFVVEHLSWSKTKGTQISSAFWGAFAFGRFSGIFTASLLTPWKILAVNLTFTFASCIVLLIALETAEIVIWICVSVAGVFIGGLFASGISFTQQRIMAITGKVYATFVMSATSGAMINPLILGTLIENYSALWFVYLSVIICSLAIGFFIILTIMVLKWGKKADPRNDGLLDRATVDCIKSCKAACCGLWINSKDI